MGASEHHKKTFEEKFQVEGIYRDGKFKEYREETQYEPTYVTATQGKILINGMMIDECYDIQYNYREMKEPIYGYNSKHWDAVLPGVVIIQGSFTINYKHDGYLHAALHAASGLLNDNGPSTRDQAIEKKEDLSLRRDLYKEQLSQVRANKERKKELKASEYQLKQSKLSSDNILKETKDAESLRVGPDGLLTKKLAQAEKDFTDLTSNLDSEQIANIKTDLGNLEEMQETRDADKAQARVQHDALTEWTASIRGSLPELRASLAEAEHNFSNQDQIVTSLLTIDDPNVDTLMTIEEAKATRAEFEKLIESLEDSIESAEDQIKKNADSIDEDMDKSISIIKQANQQILDHVENNELLKLYLMLQQEVAVAKMNLASSKEEYRNKSNKAKADSDKAVASMKNIDSELKQLATSYGDIVESLKKSKEEIDQINLMVTDLLESEDHYITKAWQRAEDHTDFNIFLEYNGDIHKALMHCDLTGHSHVVRHSGEPVKEYYTFIAQQINSNH